jgi:hypothetical protein
LRGFEFPIRVLSSVIPGRQREKGENANDQEERNQGLGKHYMNPKITAPQNRKAKAAMRSASFS